MNRDLLEQLAESDVPPVPRELERSIHDRLNTLLVVGHLSDFLLRAIPHAVAHFAEAVGELAASTLGGRPPSRSSRPPED